MALDPDERAARALELHLAGMPYSRIAEALGYSGKGAAYKAARRALGVPRRPVSAGKPGGPHPASDGRVEGADREEARTTIVTMIARLDAMRVSLWPRARRGDVEAVDRVLKIDERRERLVEWLASVAPPPAPEPSGLTEFERRLKERADSHRRR